MKTVISIKQSGHPGNSLERIAKAAGMAVEASILDDWPSLEELDEMGVEYPSPGRVPTPEERAAKEKQRGARHLTAADYLQEKLEENGPAEGMVHINSVMSEFYHDIDALMVQNTPEVFQPEVYTCSDLDAVWGEILQRSL